VKRAVQAAAVLLLAGLAGIVPLRPAVAAGTEVTKSVTATRVDLDGSVDNVVDSRTVSVSVSTTVNLLSRQLIDVNWTGAHPTGGVSADYNSYNGRLSEYPMVLLECRGIDNDAVSQDLRLTPSTCWTTTPLPRVQNSATPFPPWRLDRYETPADRKAFVGDPNGVCKSDSAAERMVPYAAADGTNYYAGINCGGMAPEATTVVDSAAPPSNNTFAASYGAEGTGHVRFEVWTEEQNASLGCSSTVPCALVAIPIEGISCDPAATGLPPEDRPTDTADDPTEVADSTAACEAKGKYQPGAPLDSSASELTTDISDSGMFWWSASNWRNRITFPLNFAQFGTACNVLDSRTPVDLDGSELMTQATAQWTPVFCSDPKLFKLRHLKIPEPLAKTTLASKGTSAALISQPPDGGYTAPTVNAPIGVTGFAISFAVDDAAGNEATDLKLDPRLLAKLLTESYLALPSLKTDIATRKDWTKALLPYQKMANNPLTIEADPEFQALNPGLGENTSVVGGAALLALSTASDVTYALAQYLNADPEARAFLDGKPDPWGMVVNPGYRGMSLPTSSWPQWDAYLPSAKVTNSEAFKYCLMNEQGQVTSSIPLLPLVASPLTSLSAIAQKQEYALLNASAQCVPSVSTVTNQINGGSFKPLGRQTPGNRFMLALTAYADGPRYGLREAELQTDSTVPNLTAKFSDAAGRDFVGPSDASLRAAMALTTADDTTHTWPIPYAKLRTRPGKDAYPGTMVVYAAVPTTGLDHATATDLGEFLEFAATTGQVTGLEEGRLPPGYLPMTAGNGLGAMVVYTRRAADLVAAQNGDAGPTVKHPTPPLNLQPTTKSTPNAGLPPSAAPSPSQGPYTPGVQLPVGYTAALTSKVAGLALPIVAAIAFVSALLAGFVRSRAGVVAMNRLQARITSRLQSRSRP
jgi:hypothetical protein